MAIPPWLVTGAGLLSGDPFMGTFGLGGASTGLMVGGASNATGGFGFANQWAPGSDNQTGSPHPRGWEEVFMGPTPGHISEMSGRSGFNPGFRDVQQPTDPNPFWDQMAQLRAGGDASRMAGPEFRQAQLGLMQQLQDQAAGRGDSLAQMQLQKGTDANIAQQMAMAQSMRGASGPAMQRQAMMNAAGAQQGMAGDAAMLRLQEQMQARAALAGLSGQARGQDMGQMGMNDASSQFWAGMGSGRDQAGIQRQIELEKLRTEANLRQQELRERAYENQQRRMMQSNADIGNMVTSKGMSGMKGAPKG